MTTSRRGDETCIAAYRWPGNVRELQNEILRIVALTDRRHADLLSPRHPRHPGRRNAGGHRSAGAMASLAAWRADGPTRNAGAQGGDDPPALEQVEGGARTSACRVVGLRAKLVRYGLERGTEAMKRRSRFCGCKAAVAAGAPSRCSAMKPFGPFAELPAASEFPLAPGLPPRVITTR